MGIAIAIFHILHYIAIPKGLQETFRKLFAFFHFCPEPNRKTPVYWAADMVNTEGIPAGGGNTSGKNNL